MDMTCLLVDLHVSLLVLVVPSLLRRNFPTGRNFLCSTCSENLATGS